MTTNSRNATCDGARRSRRDYLRTAAGLAAVSVAGCAELAAFDGGDDGAGGEDPDASAADRGTAGGDGTTDRERDDFLWLAASMPERYRDNMFAFARRHDLAVVIVRPNANVEGIEEIVRPPLEAANEFGLDAWLNVGVLNEITAREFVNDRAARETHLERLREVARVHGDLFDGGRIVLWQEAPVMGRWVEGGDWNQEAVENLLAFGPRIFDAQRRAVTAANGSLEVGNFVHFPYVVDSKRPEVFASLADRLRERDALPDFVFTDFYRGWYEKDAGPEAADEAVRSLVSNASAHTDGRDVFYIGQSHTINPGHTPSKQAMRMNLRASLEAGAAGLGWYTRPGYVPTETGFDPFVPNAEDVPFRDEPSTTTTFARDPLGRRVTVDDPRPASTTTFARDRFLYPWMATFATRSSYASGARFDLYLHGDGFGFADHRLSVRTAAGEWEFVGDVGRTIGDYPNGRRVTAFRALDGTRLVGESGELELRVATDDEGSETTLDGVYAVPWDPDAFVSESEAAEYAERGEFEPYSYGRVDPGVSLSPGETRHVSVPMTVDDPEIRSLAGLRHPDYVDEIRRLSTAEGDDGFDRRARFDLWIAGAGLADPAAAPSVIDVDGVRRRPTRAALAAAATDGAALFFGLRRDAFLDGTRLEVETDGDSRARADAAYAMPYAGSDAFRPPSRAAELLADQPDDVETFSVAHASLR